MDLVGKYLGEGSKEDAYGALTAIIGFYSKMKNRSKTSQEILDMAKGIKKYADKHNKSMSTDQALWVTDTSDAMRDMIKNPGKKGGIL